MIGVREMDIEFCRRDADDREATRRPGWLYNDRQEAEEIVAGLQLDDSATGIDNIQFHHDGFLTYDHGAEPVDAVSSVAVLHHLPDFWKLVGLRRLASMLKPGGRLFLFDVVFSFGIAEYERHIDRFIGETREQMGPGGRNESETHIREEYSTCDWIMEGLLERAGFRVETADYRNGFLAAYLCTSKGR